MVGLRGTRSDLWRGRKLTASCRLRGRVPAAPGGCHLGEAAILEGNDFLSAW